jgi:polyisoprenoid-binding protein YceI
MPTPSASFVVRARRGFRAAVVPLVALAAWSAAVRADGPATPAAKLAAAPAPAPAPAAKPPGPGQMTPAVPAAPGDLPQPGTYTLDSAHTFCTFTAQHKIVGAVRGRFDKVAGTFVVASNPADSSVDVDVDAGSVSTQVADRDQDLRGPDYLSVEKFAVATYKGKGIRRSGDGWVMDGTLSIRGESKVVPLQFVFRGASATTPGRSPRVAFHATAAVQRGAFGMIRGLQGDVGAPSDKPDVWIEIDAEAMASAPKP